MNRDKTVELDVVLLYFTASSWFVQYDEDKDPIYVPKSVSEFTPSVSDPTMGKLEVETWFAEKEGMV